IEQQQTLLVEMLGGIEVFHFSRDADVELVMGHGADRADRAAAFLQRRPKRRHVVAGGCNAAQAGDCDPMHVVQALAAVSGCFSAIKRFTPSTTSRRDSSLYDSSLYGT